MVERQHGTLNDLEDKDREVIEINADTELEKLLDDAHQADKLAAEAGIPVESVPDATVGDEETGSPVIVAGHTEDSVEQIPEPTPDTAEDALEAKEVVPDVDTEDWMSKLNEDEVFNGPDGPAPKLHGLRRLAKPFIISEESRVNSLVVVPRQVIKEIQTFNGNGDLMSTSQEFGLHHYPMASVTFLVRDIYGRTFSDSADAYYLNCNELGHFPTAVASARAEARVLRKLLNIKQHAAEELTDKDATEELAPDDDAPAKPEQVKLIDKMLSSLQEFSLKDLIDNITTREIYTVEELTTGEARKALRILNDQKKKNKRKSKK